MCYPPKPYVRFTMIKERRVFRVLRKYERKETTNQIQIETEIPFQKTQKMHEAPSRPSFDSGSGNYVYVTKTGAKECEEQSKTKHDSKTKSTSKAGPSAAEQESSTKPSGNHGTRATLRPDLIPQRRCHLPNPVAVMGQRVTLRLEQVRQRTSHQSKDESE